MRQVLWYLVAVDALLDLLPMVSVVAERIEHLGKGEVWQMDGNFLRINSKAPHLYNRAYGGPCPYDDRLPAEDISIPHNVTVFCLDRHSVPVSHLGHASKTFAALIFCNNNVLCLKAGNLNHYNIPQ